MVKRYVGGVISAIAPTISANLASGFFNTSGAAQAKQSGLWASVPGAPTSVTGTSSDSQATISFTPPTNNGGYPITQYTVTSNPGNITATGTGSGIVVTGLTNGVSYTFTVTATNLLGTGPSSSPSSSITPQLIFPTAYQSLIDSWSGNLKLFVNATTGSDTLNNGLSASSPFATINKAQDYRNTTLSSGQTTMIVVYPGTYTMTPFEYSSSSSGLSDSTTGLSTRPTTYVCAPKQTIIQWTATSVRDAALVFFQPNTNSKIYGAILKRNNNGKGAGEPYAVAFFNNTTSNFYGSLYNCAIVETNANGNWSLQYDNGANMTGKVYNCSFYVTEGSSGDYSGGTSFVVDKSVFNWTYTPTYANVANSLVLTNHDMNSTTYVSPGTTTQGVYYGTYAWPA